MARSVGSLSSPNAWYTNSISLPVRPSVALDNWSAFARLSGELAARHHYRPDAEVSPDRERSIPALFGGLEPKRRQRPCGERSGQSKSVSDPRAFVPNWPVGSARETM